MIAEAITGYPEFDICAQTLPERFDLIIADQVFEHLKWPYRAARNVLAMLRPGGHFVVTARNPATGDGACGEDGRNLTAQIQSDGELR